eukprot:GHVR01000426.1.p1 GENE.GHVR01000426.1~~GHVR01000426.1.p1  ORF type:complete len:233 (-),score=37.53 GHVR01000426.1:53-751(-)
MSFNKPQQIEAITRRDDPHNFNKYVKDQWYKAASHGVMNMLPGDIVIIISDGVTDNLSNDEIEETVNNLFTSAINSGDIMRQTLPPPLNKLMPPCPVHIVAEVLWAEAYKKSVRAVFMPNKQPVQTRSTLVPPMYPLTKPTWQTPFTESIRRLSGKTNVGGKPDDITVAVAVVVGRAERNYLRLLEQEASLPLEKRSSRRCANCLFSLVSPLKLVVLALHLETVHVYLRRHL